MSDRGNVKPGAPGEGGSDLIGKRIRQIRVLEVLGRGGMGMVYLGFDETLHRKVALKAIRSRHRLTPEVRVRFLREARTLSRLEHPSICGIYDYIQGDSADFLVLELIEGDHLAAAVAEGLEPAQRLAVAIRIAEVLVAAHGEGIIHRDLKPENVMLTASGGVKVLDFGLAREAELTEGGEAGAVETANTGDRSASVSADEPLPRPSDETEILETGTADAPSDGSVTRLGQTVGTPAYMSPEQARGEPLTTASDMYSFGLLLQSLFTGERCYPAGLSGKEVLEWARRGETLPVTGLDSDLQRLIERLKSLAPAARLTALDTLERLRWIEDKPRRRWRRLGAAAVVLALAAGGAKYTFDLKTARDEAQTRRQQAEDLIGFMIGDLRTKLAPVNRLEVLDEIGERALRYFAAVAPEDLSNEELLFRSRTLSQIGQVRLDQGNLEEAARALDESLALAADLVERDPRNADWRAHLGAAHFWVGNVFWQQGDLDGALASFRDYLSEAEALVELDAGNPDWRLELSYAHSNIGSVLEAAGDASGAIAAFRSSLATERELAAEQPDNQQLQVDLAGSHSWLGRALFAEGDLEASLENHRADLEILEGLTAEDDANLRWRWLLGIAHLNVGWVLEALGRAEEAERRYLAALELHEDLTSRDPENTAWRSSLAFARQRLGSLEARARGLPEARARLREARRGYERLVETDPSNVEWRQGLAYTLVSISRALETDGAVGDDGATARRAVEISEKLLAEQPADPEAAWLCAEAHLAFGLARRDAAPASFERAVEVLEPVARASRHPLRRETWARALLQTDRIDEARPILAALRAEGFDRPGFGAGLAGW